MPIYEYKCVETGNIYEIEQSINENAFDKCVMLNCPCGGNSPTHRIISKNIGVIFNGNGFYETDYARKNSHTKEGNNKKINAPCNSCSDTTCPHSQQ